MKETSLAERASDGRRAPRANMFLAATLNAESWSGPVKLRNLSATGGMLEAAALPKSGSPIRLIRGRLTVSGHIMWTSSNRCGVRFSSLVSPKDWMAPAANGEQQHVDNVIALVKAGAAPLDHAADARRSQFEAHGEVPLPTAASKDLQLVADLIQRVADRLSADAAILDAHPADLQQLDIGIQALLAIAGGDAARLNDLRASVARALRKR